MRELEYLGEGKSVGFIFNGIKKDYIEILASERRPTFAPLTRRFLTIPGMAGAYLASTDTSIRSMIVPIIIDKELAGYSSLEKIKEDLAAWLITDSPVSLIFEDEPDREYYAVVDGSLDLDEIVNYSRGVITFFCPDPYKYGVQEKLAVISSGETALNEGTAETFPLFTANVLEPITFLDIVSPESYMRIGEPIDVEKEVPFAKEQRMLWHQCNNLTGWANATFVDGGVVSGTMATDSTKFLASGYGSGSVWHGPAIKTSIPGGPLTDFRVDALVGLGNGQVQQMGRVEIYLLDDANKAIGKMAMKDTSKGAAAAFGEARIGDNTINHFLIEEYGDERGNWNNFYGMLRIERVGNKWTAYIAKIAQGSGRHHTRRTVTFFDEDYLFDKQVAQIAVHVGQYENQTTAAPAIYDLKVFRINQTDDTQIPFIADAGDVIEIDHKIKEIRINGETRNDLKEFGGSFFPIGKGETQLTVNPPTAATVEARWRDKWL